MTDYRLEGSEWERLQRENERLKAVIDALAFRVEVYTLRHSGTKRLEFRLGDVAYVFNRDEKSAIGILEAIRQLYLLSSYAGDEDAANTDAAREGG